MYFLEGKPKAVEPEPANEARAPSGVDNRSYVPDTITMQQISGRTNDKNYY